MNKKQIKMMCFDLDNTLVSPGTKPMSELNKNMILKASKEGIECLLTTGRALERAINYAKNISSKYLVVYSGALVYKLPEQKIIFKKIILKKNWKIIKELVDQNKELVAVSYWLEEKTNKTITFIQNKPNPEFGEHKISLENIKLFSKNNKNFECLRFNVFGPWKKLKKIEKNLNDLNLSVIKNKDTLFEITNKRAKKSVAVKFLSKKLNISFSEIMAFGDSLNDLDLFQKVGYGIAVENAREELKKISFDICGNFKISGVGIYLKNKFFNK